VHPEVVDAMRSRGIDLSPHAPQKLTSELASTANWLITMGCGDECPVVPGAHRDDWPIQDPKGQPPATVDAIIKDLDDRVRSFMRSSL
jgi:arsenate reductase